MTEVLCMSKNTKEVYIHRFIEADLLEWKLNDGDKVLFISGCPQVGKTTSLNMMICGIV